MNMSRRLKSALNQCAATADEALRDLSVFREDHGQAVCCSYSLDAGGKRIRPFFVLQSCAALGGNRHRAVPAACSVEMIHTYSLIHDDLPGMDDDSIRRGKPSLHVVYGTENALFAGDRLLLEAFRTLITTDLSSLRVRVMLRRLVSAAGACSLVGGQFMDMYHPDTADRSWTERMVSGKTSAMIRVSMELGSIVAGVSDGELEAISEIGEDTGWLFQLTDDILDVTGNPEEMGKAVSKDADMGKWNPVNELGVDGAKKLALENAASISQRLDSLSGDWSVVKELIDYLPERRK
ncbi:MAG: polyprenyl synthetase family protein [Candidatus Fermentibacteraceae bacterium]|nr:polyprenyl synthetase family protein [Candidatus Fermentibacteraceae bacterium]